MPTFPKFPDPVHAPSLASIPWLRHAFTTRTGGISTAYGRIDDLNLGFTPHDTSAAVQENRHRLLEAVTAPPEVWTLATARQTHSATILTLSKAPHPSIEADALTTAVPSLLLAILTADCVPVLIADTRRRIVAAFHAGWRGTAAHIVERGIQALRDRHNARPEDLHAAIGPSIGPCCYRVGEEVRQAFPENPTLYQDNHLDLWEANRRQLLAAGLPSTQIELLAQCTACTRTPDGRRKFFSHRAEQAHTGRMMSLIGIVPETPIH